MATRFAEIEPIINPLDTFTRVEEEIRSFYDELVRAVTEKRDQLIVQLNDLKLDYLNKEEMRVKQIRELEKMIGQLDEMSLQQNPIVKLQGDHLEQMKDELKKYERPTPVPVPGFRTEGLQSLLQQLERIGTIEEVGRLYSNRVNPIRSIGKEGTKKGEFSYPRGISIDGENKIYVCDYNSRIQVFSKEGKFLTEFGKGQLDRPHAITLCDKWVFVSDLWLGIILKFQIPNYKVVAKSEKVLNYPKGLTVDKNEVLVADSANNRIAVFSSDLQFLREIGKGKLDYPQDVKINSNKIFVVDSSKPHNVHVFSRSADPLYSMISLRNGTNFIFMCFDQFSNIIISDWMDKSIQIFTLEGQLIHYIKCEANPKGIAVTNDNTIVCANNPSSVKFY